MGPGLYTQVSVSECSGLAAGAQWVILMDGSGMWSVMSTLLHLAPQEMEHNVKLLEEQQDEFDFKYQTRMMEGGL